MNRRTLAVLSYGHFATDLAQGALPALLPVFKALFHLSYFGVGFIVLIFSTSSSLIQPGFGLLSDRLRLRWLMPIGVLVATLGIALATLSRDYSLTLVTVFLAGLGVAAFHPEGYRYAGLISKDRPATGMSYFAVGGNLGIGIGPAVASLVLSVAGAYGMTYLLALGIPAAVLLWKTSIAGGGPTETVSSSLASIPAYGDSVSSRRGSKPPRTVLVLLVVFVILRSWVSVGTANLIPLFFTGVRHFDPRYGATLASVFLGAGAIGTLLGGRAADLWGRRPLLIFSMAFLPPVLWMLTRTSGPWTILAAALSGMAVVSSFAVIMVIAQDLIPERIGMISGLIIGFAVGMGGPGLAVLGAVADRWGLMAAMDTTALLPIVGLVVALLLPADQPHSYHRVAGRMEVGSPHG